MTFPFDFSGEIKFDRIPGSKVESFQRKFMDAACKRFERVHADVEIYPCEISFRVSASGLPLFEWYPLLFACSGKILLNPEESSLTYHVSFIDSIIFLSLATWGLIGSFCIIVVNGSLLVRIAIVIFVWLFTVLAANLIAVSRFEQFVERILREINVRAL